MAEPVVVVASGGVPVVDATPLTGTPLTNRATAGVPVTPVESGARPVTIVSSGAPPVVFIAENGADYLIGGAIPILDLVSVEAAGAAYGLVKLRSAYSGSPIQMRALVATVLTTQDIAFSGNIVSVAAANAFAATADAGSTIEVRFYDQSGNGNHSTFVSAAVPGMRWTALTVNGLPLATTDQTLNNSAATIRQGLLIPSGVALNMNAYSVAFLGRTHTATPQIPSIIFETTTPRHDIYNSTQTTTTGGLTYYDGTTQNKSSAVIEGSAAIHQYMVGSTTVNAVINDISYSFAKGSTATTSVGGCMGGYSLGAGYIGNHDFIAMVIFNRVLSAADQAKVSNWGSRLLGGPTRTQDRFILVGDSSLQARGCQDNQSWDVQALPLLNRSLRLFKNATSSIAASTLLTNNAQNVALYKAGAFNLFAVQCGYNDLIGGATPAAASTSALSICAALRATGGKVLFVPSQKIVTSSISQVNQDAFVALMAAGVGTSMDAIAGNWADPIIGSAGDPTNTTYYNTDQIHMKMAAQTIMKNYVVTAANALL